MDKKDLRRFISIVAVFILVVLIFGACTVKVQADNLQNFGVVGVDVNAMNSTCTYQYIKDPTYRNNALTAGGNVGFYHALYSNEDYIGINANLSSYNNIDSQGYNLTTIPLSVQFRHYFYNTGLFGGIGLGYNLIVNETTDYETTSGVAWNCGGGYDVGNFELAINYLDNVFYYQKFTAPHQLNYGAGSFRTAGIQTSLDYLF